MVSLAFLLHFFLACLLHGNAVLARVETAELAGDPLCVAVRVEDILTLVLVRLKILLIDLIVDFFDDLVFRHGLVDSRSQSLVEGSREVLCRVDLVVFVNLSDIVLNLSLVKRVRVGRVL